MGLIMLFGAEESFVMWLSLVGALLLTGWEVREQGLDRKTAMWWLLLVLLVHVLGYIALRVWVAATTRRATP